MLWNPRQQAQVRSGSVTAEQSTAKVGLIDTELIRNIRGRPLPAQRVVSVVLASWLVLGQERFPAASQHQQRRRQNSAADRLAS